MHRAFFFPWEHMNKNGFLPAAFPIGSTIAGKGFLGMAPDARCAANNACVVSCLFKLLLLLLPDIRRNFESTLWFSSNKDSKLCLRISAFLLISKDSAAVSWTSSLGSVLDSDFEAETTLSTLELESAEDSSEDELELSKSFSSESESSIQD